MVARGLAPTPPMGWNSWDCFGPSVTEEEVRRNAELIAARLAPSGWRYVVVDIQWYEPAARAGGYRPHAALVLDGYGRPLPAPNRFPSARDGAGFRPLADFVHGLGLAFGVHGAWTSSRPTTCSPHTTELSWPALGMSRPGRLRDLWYRASLPAEPTLRLSLDPHDAALLRPEPTD